MTGNLKLWLLCGRLDGWDDDIAVLVQAFDEGQAQRIFVDHHLLGDSGYEPGERDHYVHQSELVGEYITPDTLMVAQEHQMPPLIAQA
jgi:hypothetical protein